MQQFFYQEVPLLFNKLKFSSNSKHLPTYCCESDTFYINNFFFFANKSIKLVDCGVAVWLKTKMSEQERSDRETIEWHLTFV